MGCMPLSIKKDRPSEAEAVKVLLAAVDAGINFFDTADCYCQGAEEFGHNERLVGRAIAQLKPSERERLVIATKGGITRPEGRWERRGDPDYLKKACESSLRNLGVDQIAVYQHHRIDPNVPFHDSLEAFAELRSTGKIAHAAVSNYGVEEILAGQKIVPLVSVQNEYSPDHRQPEWPIEKADPSLDPNTAGTLAATGRLGMAFLPWCPLGGMGKAKEWTEKSAQLKTLAGEVGVSPQQLILAWHLSRGPQVIPIPGASRVESITDSAQAADLSLAREVLVRLETILTPEAE